MSKQVHSFAPIEGDAVKILILGSMPGLTSLKANEYYGHRRNAFWPIIMALINKSTPSFSIFEQTSYAQRCNQLRTCGIAIWDVLAACERPGSLDNAIVRSSEQANDIGALVKRHPGLRTIVFNGKAAEKLFHRHMDVNLQAANTLTFLAKPSTSPAMASLDLMQKYTAWKTGLPL